MSEFDEHTPASQVSSAAGPGERGVVLAIFHRGENHLHRLANGKSVVMGRSESADISLRDQTLSRLHLRIAMVAARNGAQKPGSGPMLPAITMSST